MALRLLATIFVVALLCLGAPERGLAQQDAGIDIGTSDIGGVVTGPNGPEAGVWVIAETTDLPTKFARIVVTDDRGRYLIPDLPKANYSVWVRGYAWWIRRSYGRSRASCSTTPRFRRRVR
jgi:hypothetical protein